MYLKMYLNFNGILFCNFDVYLQISIGTFNRIRILRCMAQPEYDRPLIDIFWLSHAMQTAYSVESACFLYVINIFKDVFGF